MVLERELKEVIREYFDEDKILEIKAIDQGHINSTYLVKLPECTYILQRINDYVFVNPYGVMHNIETVTKWIKKKLIYFGKNPNRSLLNIVRSIDDQVIVIVDDSYWRCFQYIENATTYDTISSKEMFEEIGVAVGEFQTLLHNFPSHILDETIKHFHDTPYRYEHFKQIVNQNIYHRVKDCEKEISFFKNHEDIYDSITFKLRNNIIPYRVNHNDTKINNVMIDNTTKKALCLIDLDTVMRGTLLYDYGDALRLGASTAKEDETDLSKVMVDLELFRYFTRGFLKVVKPIITTEEVKSLYDGYLLMTIEVAMRFLEDYISGDKYFRIEYPEHNLIRCKNQIKLAKEIKNNREEIITIINSTLKELDYSESYIFA